MKMEALMDRIRVSSTNIRSVGYDEGAQILEVEFKSGGVYSYKGVPKNVHQQFMAAPSKGRFFDTSIKDKYPTTKLR
jgi:KTSC domain-containing protein